MTYNNMLRLAPPKPDYEAEMAKVKRDVELMGYGFLVDDVRVPMSRITWFNRPGEVALPTRKLPTGPRVYISGPMTGIADLNAPAFAAEAARLLALGYQVENPADVVLPDGATWADFMRADIPRLLACTHIRMLDGWTMSKGARLEHHIAISLGLEVLTDDDLQEQK